MNESIKKLTKIIDELTTIFLINKAKGIDIKLIKNTDEFLLEFSVDSLDFDTFSLEDFIEELDNKREDNAEEYYWQLSGTNENLSELHLIGMMIDNFQVFFSPFLCSFLAILSAFLPFFFHSFNPLTIFLFFSLPFLLNLFFCF